MDSTPNKGMRCMEDYTSLDESAFGELVRSSQAVVLACLRRKGVSLEDAEELTYAAYVVVWQSRERVPVDSRHRLRWLLRIAMNGWLNLKRKNDCRSKHLLLLSPDLMSNLPNPSLSNSAGPLDLDVEARLRSCLSRLERPEQVSLARIYEHLAVILKLDSSEVPEKPVGESSNAEKQRRYRAMAKLRRCVNGESMPTENGGPNASQPASEHHPHEMELMAAVRGEARPGVLEHLESCSSCQDIWMELEELEDELAGLGKRTEDLPPAEMLINRILRIPMDDAETAPRDQRTAATMLEKPREMTVSTSAPTEQDSRRGHLLQFPRRTVVSALALLAACALLTVGLTRWQVAPEEGYLWKGIINVVLHDKDEWPVESEEGSTWKGGTPSKKPSAPVDVEITPDGSQEVAQVELVWEGDDRWVATIPANMSVQIRFLRPVKPGPWTASLQCHLNQELISFALDGAEKWAGEGSEFSSELQAGGLLSLAQANIPVGSTIRCNAMRGEERFALELRVTMPSPSPVNGR